MGMDTQRSAQGDAVSGEVSGWEGLIGYVFSASRATTKIIFMRGSSDVKATSTLLKESVLAGDRGNDTGKESQERAHLL